MKRIRLTGVLLMFGLAAGCAHHRVDLTRESSQIDVGVDAAKMNLWREALFRFQRAVQIDPNDAMAHNNLAVAYEGTGDFEKARANYIEALRLDKGNEYIQKNFSRFTEFTSRNRKRGKTAPVTATKSTKANSSSPAPTTSQPEVAVPPSVASPAGTAPSTAPPSGSPAIPATGAPPAPSPGPPTPAPPKPPSPGGSL